LNIKSAKYDAHTTAPNLFPCAVSTNNQFAWNQSALISQASSDNLRFYAVVE
jgi:hypothetical protein